MVDFSDGFKNAFHAWDIRIFVLISLLFQVLQILFASGRKRCTSKAFTFFTWSIYLLADWVAGFTLGLLCHNQGDSNCDAALTGRNTMINTTVVNNVPLLSTSKHKLNHNYNGDLLAFWAPFLLLHLGGPDTITAFSMEDNSLWRRHLLGVLFQVGIAIYVLLLSLPHNKILAPTILMFLSGIIKYSERTYALYCASSDVFRDSIATQEFNKLKLPEGFNIGERHSNMVQLAHELFMYFRGIIVDQRSFTWRKPINKYFANMKSSEAFKLVEYELSFVYDVLFTKAAVLHTCVGYTLRFLCTSLNIAAFVLFFLSNNRHDFTSLDVLITYILLGGAILLDISAYIMLICSKWTIVRLKELESRFNFIAPLIISRIIFKAVSTSSEWSGSMMQHSFVKACLHHHRSSHLKWIVDTIRRSFRVDVKLFYKSTWSEPITDELKEFIFQCISDKYQKLVSIKDENQLFYEFVKVSSSRGSLVLEKYNIMDEFRYSIDVRFEKSILMWHIATDVCYYTDERNNTIQQKTRMDFSMRISNYMLYLLFMRPWMIPSVTNWHLMYQATREELESSLKWHDSGTLEPNTISIDQQLKQVYNHFLSLSEDLFFNIFASAAGEALVLAKKLKKKVKDEDGWKMVSEIWVDMFQYAAMHCPGIAHAQALSNGGELLTIVGFSISHLGYGHIASFVRENRNEWKASDRDDMRFV